MKTILPPAYDEYSPKIDQIDATALAVARAKNRMEQRHRERTFGFQGANVTRLNNDWWRSPQSADSEMRYALRNLRFRCRELERNNDWMRKLLHLFEDNVVGSTGIQLQMKIYDMVKDPATKEMVRKLDSRSCEIIESAWREQCSPANYTVTRDMSAIRSDRLIIRSIVRDGDILLRKIRGYSNRFRYAIQILEADYLDDFYSDMRTLPNGNQVRMGVEVDAWKCPAAYWVLTQHPGDFNYGWDAQRGRFRLPAEECIHPFVRERPEQSRGYPWPVASMNRLNMFGGYEEAEVVAARLAACKGGFYEHDRPQVGEFGGGYQGQTDGQSWQPLQEMQPGQYEDLPMGTKFKPNDPQHPHSNFPAFSKQQLRAVASSCGVSYNSLASDLENVNFSSIRAGLLDERETYKGTQNFYIETSKNPYFEDWLEWVLLGEMLPGLPKLSAANIEYLNQKVWRGRRWDWVDPLKDINAAVTAIEAGLETRSENISDRGGDFEEIMDELAYEKDVIEDKGLDFASAQPSTQKPNFPDQEKPEEEQDQEEIKKTKSLRELLSKRKRANPHHAKQPRHPNGKWKEADLQNISTLLEIMKLSLAGKPIRVISEDKTEREWTQEEIADHAQSILNSK